MGIRQLLHAIRNRFDGKAFEVWEAANTYMRNNYRGMGADALVEMRMPVGPFDFTDATNTANFPGALWIDRTHPNSAGHAYTARYIADVLVNLRGR